MKKIFSIALMALVALTLSLNVDAKKKEICFQMYSVRDLIGNPEKFAQNHKDVLAKLAAMGYMSHWSLRPTSSTVSTTVTTVPSASVLVSDTIFSL